MKICVVSPLFSIAGVPLAQLRFARALAAAGHDVELVLGHVSDGHVLPPVDQVKITVLEKRNVRGMLFPLCSHFRIRQPDLIFSAEDHLNVIVLLAAIISASRAKISCSSRVTPFDTYSNTPFTKRWILKWLSRMLMWRADALTCVSKDMVAQYRQVFPGAPHVCVYNIVGDAHSQLRMAEPLEDPWVKESPFPVIAAAGRLAPWKGFPDLIAAMKIVLSKRPARLIIMGDGPMKTELQAQIEELQIGEHVKLVGYVENPLKYFSHADVFVLSSLVEGLPNVLVEAMLCGCTPVATDCPTGPREVLQGGKYGFLVPMRDPLSLADAICSALEEPYPRELLLDAISPFREAAVIARHFEVLGIAVDKAAETQEATA